MYLFFMIGGYLFVTASSVLLLYLFEMFSINAFTKFLKPLEKTTFNYIGISILPNIIWAFIELIAMASNKLFILSFIFNIFITISIMYVIKNGYEMINKKESESLEPISIFISCFLGFICNYMCLLIGINHEINAWASFFMLISLTAIYVILRLYPPKTEFFKGPEE